MLSSGFSRTKLILHDSLSSLLDVKQQSLQYYFLILRKMILVFIEPEIYLVTITKQEKNSRNQKNAFRLLRSARTSFQI